MSAINRDRPRSTIARRIWEAMFPIMPHRKTINTYLPMELLREIFLYCIEVNQMKSGQLASVCRYWRSIIIGIASIWSTLRVGTWTERERVATWLQRAHPKNIVIDTQRDRESSSETPAFAALQSALTDTDQWHGLTISTFPPENLVSQLGIQAASAMNVLKVIHIADGCVHSPSFAHLLNLVPTEAETLSPICQHPLSPTPLVSYFAESHSAYCQWQRSS